MVQVAPNLTLIDLTIRGLAPGTYHATVRESGDISSGAESVGGIWDMVRAKKEGSPSSARGVFGTVTVGKDGLGSVFLDKPIQIWEMIGRSIVVAREQDGKYSKEDPDTLVGVIARSAGVWSNDKTICSCRIVYFQSHYARRTNIFTVARPFGKKEKSRLGGVCCEELNRSHLGLYTYNSHIITSPSVLLISAQPHSHFTPCHRSAFQLFNKSEPPEPSSSASIVR